MVSDFPQKYEAAQQFSILLIIRNVSKTAKQHIRMISVGSCDTEDWSNDVENSAFSLQFCLQQVKCMLNQIQVR